MRNVIENPKHLSTSCISLCWKVPWRCGRMADYVECSASARTSYVLRLPYCRILFNSAIRIFFVRTERSGGTLCRRLDGFLRPSVLWLVFSAHEFYLSKLCVFLATSCVGGINLDPQVTECISHDTLHIEHVCGATIESQYHDQKWLKTKTFVGGIKHGNVTCWGKNALGSAGFGRQRCSTLLEMCYVITMLSA